MATTKSDREVALQDLLSKFDRWENMSDEDLLAELQKAMCCNVTSKSRWNTVKALVRIHVERKMI
jgi:hypothetical protein